MDFYKLSSKLRKARRQHSLSAGAQALFYELIAICNEERWPDVFKCPNGELSSAISCAEKTLILYRDELAASGLIQFQSGKSKRQPCNYSLNDCLNSLPNGLLNGGKIYSNSVSQTGEKTTDLIKHKSKTINKDFIEVEDDNVQARQKKIEDAIIDYTSNASFEPQQTHLPDEKEKNSAQKEKVLPVFTEVIEKIVTSQTCHWPNVLKHHKELDEDGRLKLFEIFYDQKADTYKVRYPTITDIASNFYYWISLIKKLNKLDDLLNGNAKQQPDAPINVTKNSFTKRATAADKRNELRNLNQQSGEFLRRTAG